MSEAQYILDLVTMAEAVQPCVIEPRRYYAGIPLEKGGTSIAGKGAAPSIRWLFEKGHIKPEHTVLDYGAGKYSRNGDYLRDKGCSVFCYDPFNGAGRDGWEMGQVASSLPSGTKFDIGFTCFVLNVVPKGVEENIVSDLGSRCRTAFHITRNLDIFDSVRSAMRRNDKTVAGFFKKEFATEAEAVECDSGTLDDQIILEFCRFGVQTSRGFQRIPCPDMKILRQTAGFKIYQD